MYSKYRNTDHGIEILEDNKEKFLKTLKNGEVFYTTYHKEKDARTLLQNNYLYGGIYPCFVPNNFDDIYKAHEYFGNEFLMKTEVINTEDLESLARITKTFRSKNPIISMDRIPIYKGKKVIRENLRIVYVKSTAALRKREFNDYKESIQRFGAEIDVIVPDPNEDF